MSGNSAYVIADVGSGGMHIVEAVKEPRHKSHVACEAYLLQMLKKHKVDAIAVDAPLSLPRALVDAAYEGPPREGSGEIINPYLFRYTDYWLYKRFGLKPMPPAGDRIGRLTARAISLLQKLDYRFPEAEIEGRRIPFYEVYPKQIAHALGEAAYKKDAAALLEILKPDKAMEDEHLVDALLCCYAGYKIVEGSSVMPPAGVEQEGWCFPVVSGPLES